jgi:leucyl/phenylalanyl-tRNA--protein transferase
MAISKHRSYDYLPENLVVVVTFPPVHQANADGLLAVGGDLEVESLLLAYRSGIFPWPYDEQMLTWYAPPKRGVLFLSDFHVSKRLERTLRQGVFTCKRDTDFRGVISRCAEVKNRGRQRGTWITENIINAYCDFFEHGYCSCFEAYKDGELVGGLYGVRIGKFFAAESSFYRVSDASKVAMCFMAEQLKAEGLEWFDCQVLTPFSESFGARELPRREFMRMLKLVQE